MKSTIRIRDTIAMLFAVAAGAILLGQSVSADLHVPAARILVAECQGFEALASTGGHALTCAADPAAAGGTAVAPKA